VQIEDAEARAAVLQAKAAVDQANARVAQLRRVGTIVASEALRQADTTLEHAELELARVQSLAASGAVAQAPLDDARHAVDLARAQKAAAEAQHIASTPMGAESRIALTALLQAEAQYTGANVRLAQTRILARQDGVVLTRSVEQGDVVQPARTLMVLAADASPELVFQPDERNLAWIALGQKARASADAYPQQPFDAQVSYIAPSIDPQRGSVEVRLTVPHAPAFLLPDMTVSVDLAVARRENALTVPSAALRDAATPAPWLFTVEGGRLVRKGVKLGIRGEGTVEIAGGLAEGSLVVLPDGRVHAPGLRVRTESD
jgi:HlyD family secretion protein